MSETNTLSKFHCSLGSLLLEQHFLQRPVACMGCRETAGTWIRGPETPNKCWLMKPRAKEHWVLQTTYPRPFVFPDHPCRLKSTPSCSWSRAALLLRPQNKCFHSAAVCYRKRKQNKSEWEMPLQAVSWYSGGNPWLLSDVYFITSNKHVNYQNEAITPLIYLGCPEMLGVGGAVRGGRKKENRAPPGVGSTS